VPLVHALNAAVATAAAAAAAAVETAAVVVLTGASLVQLLQLVLRAI
jgi:hypothetical protein